MENIENNVEIEKPVIIDSKMSDFLIETAKWGKFLAIIGYIFMGIIALLGIFIMLKSSLFGNLYGSKLPFGVFGIFYIILAAVYYIPVNYLFRFSTQMQQGLKSNDSFAVSNGFGYLKSLFKFMGVFTIVIISLYLVILLLIVPIFMYFK